MARLFHLGSPGRHLFALVSDRQTLSRHPQSGTSLSLSRFLCYCGHTSEGGRSDHVDNSACTHELCTDSPCNFDYVHGKCGSPRASRGNHQVQHVETHDNEEHEELVEEYDHRGREEVHAQKHGRDNRHEQENLVDHGLYNNLQTPMESSPPTSKSQMLPATRTLRDIGYDRHRRQENQLQRDILNAIAANSTI